MTRPMTFASRTRRAAAGLVLTLLAILGIGTPWTWIGIVPLTAGAIGWCPLQALRDVLRNKRNVTGAGISLRANRGLHSGHRV